VGIAGAPREKRVVEQKRLTAGKSALLLVLSALGAFVSAKVLHGWQMYLGFALVGIAVFIGFLAWNRES
jgi:hypothetical protein